MTAQITGEPGWGAAIVPVATPDPIPVLSAVIDLST